MTFSMANMKMLLMKYLYVIDIRREIALSYYSFDYLFVICLLLVLNVILFCFMLLVSVCMIFYIYLRSKRSCVKFHHIFATKIDHATNKNINTIVYSIMIRDIEVDVLSQDVETREEGGTPAIVEAIRAGLVMQLKKTITAEFICSRNRELAKYGGFSLCRMNLIVCLCLFIFSLFV